MKFVIKLVDTIMEINSIYDYIYKLCEDYIVSDDSACEFIITSSIGDILEEKNNSSNSDSDFSLPVYESTFIHRSIVSYLIQKDIFLIHSAVVVKDNYGYSFLAKSGVGKSTHVNLWLKAISNSYILNGDKPMYQFNDNCLYVFGTPWKGKEGLGVNSKVQIKSFCFIERSDSNAIRKASSHEIISRLFKQVLIPTKKNDVEHFMSFLNRIIKEIPFYILKCNIDDEAAILAYTEMNKETINNEN